MAKRDSGKELFMSSAAGRLIEENKDITERRRAENLVQARLRMSVAASTVSMSVDQFLQMALDEIEAQTGSTVGFYHFVETDQETLTLQGWSTNTVRSMCTADGKGSHKIQMDLRPSMLDDLGLLPTISWFCRRFQAIYVGIRVDQEMGIEEKDVPDSLKIVIYRIIQEAMNNIAKHSQADLVRLWLREIDDRMELIIQDNGRGFMPDGAASTESTRRGLGLTSMRERAEFSGGSFAIESRKSKGTVIRASWPLS